MRFAVFRDRRLFCSCRYHQGVPSFTQHWLWQQSERKRDRESECVICRPDLGILSCQPTQPSPAQPNSEHAIRCCHARDALEVMDFTGDIIGSETLDKLQQRDMEQSCNWTSTLRHEIYMTLLYVSMCRIEREWDRMWKWDGVRETEIAMERHFLSRVVC